MRKCAPVPAGPTPLRPRPPKPIPEHPRPPRPGLPVRTIAWLLLGLGVAQTAGAAVNLRAGSVEPPPAGSDCSSLELSGRAEIGVANAGDEALAGVVDVLLFADLDQDGLFDAGSDRVLGTSALVPPLAPGEEVLVAVDAAGRLPFRDAPLHAWVDSGEVLAESDEADNRASTASACARPQPASDFDPVLEWEWNEAGVGSTPLVGDVNADGTPDVVFTTEGGVLQVLDGASGGGIWSTAGPPAPAHFSSPALGELDGDPGLEVVTLSADLHHLVAFDDDGSLWWVSDELEFAPRGPLGGVTLADLNCDGVAEALFGPEVFDATNGRRFWTVELGGTLGTNDRYPGFATPADLNGDGDLEVLAGPTAYDWDPTSGRGVLLWRQEAVPEGYTALGQFDADDAPEVVIVHQGRMFLLEGDTGELVWEVDVPAGGGGCDVLPFRLGAPTIADFDGDGAAEIGVAGADWYVVFEGDGSVKWQVPIVDCSSSFTSSTVFDFEDDGAAEVVYQDELFLRVLRGTDGSELVAIPSSSLTIQEMVTIADVDGDNRAEIVAPLNRGGGGPWQGIRVYGDRTDNWVSTRRIWNQNAYHVGNVNEDGSIPADGVGGCEEPSWLTHGTYRAQRRGESPPLGLPDLTLTTLDHRLVLDADCRLRLEVDGRLGNAGSHRAGRPVEIWFHEGEPSGGGRAIASLLAPDLRAGEWWDFRASLPVRGPFTLHVLADSDGTPLGSGRVAECREDNNRCEIEVDRQDPSFPAPLGPALRVRDHGDPRAGLISASLEWSGDWGLPRPDGDHYHVLRGTRPDELSPVTGLHPWTALALEDATPRAAELPACHHYRVLAANECELTQPLP